LTRCCQSWPWLSPPRTGRGRLGNRASSSRHRTSWNLSTPGTGTASRSRRCRWWSTTYGTTSGGCVQVRRRRTSRRFDSCHWAC
jgi:hypothetical protein